MMDKDNEKMDMTVVEDEIPLSQIQNLVYVIRGQQVMLDSDLAMLYQVETKQLNRAVKRNKQRFPMNFCFQLTDNEYEVLRCQFGTSKINDGSDSEGRGGRRYLPYVFNEQGIAMLSAVLRSETAIRVSIQIMTAFVEMRKFISSNALLFERISEVELKQIDYQKKSEEKFEQLFDYLSEHEQSQQKIFYDGQIYDAFRLLVDIIQSAEKSVLLIDNYVDLNTLNILAKKKKNVDVRIYTLERTTLSKTDVKLFNTQYPFLSIEYIGNFHDRFLILDDERTYHIGASLKDAGKKCFALSLLKDKNVAKDIIGHIKSKRLSSCGNK